MKKSLFFAGLAFAALSLTGCKQETDFAGPGRKVEIVLSDAATRTVNSVLATEWKDGDNLTVFNAPTGTAAWSSNLKFSVKDASTNRAEGTAELADGSYDWYAFYPYGSKIPNPTTLNPAGSEYERSGYTTVGGQFQKQKQDDDMGHLAGTTVPVFGNVKNVPAGETPVIEMKNAAAVVRFKVVNKQEEEIKFLSVKFTAPEDIVGTYYIDFSGVAPAFVASGETYVFDNVTVTNLNPSGVSPDSNSEIYAVIKPFTASSGASLKVEVEGENVDGTRSGTVTKEIVLTTDVEFKPGFIKTLNIPFDCTMSGVDAKTLPYSEPFKGVGIGDFKIEDVSRPSELTYIWSYDAKYGMKASAKVGGKAYASVSRLVSPRIDLSSASAPVLSFKHALNQFSTIESAKAKAKVYIRPVDGDWTELAVDYPASLSWAFVESGSVDLSDYVGGEVQIAFQYSSTAEDAGTWEIQDFLVDDGVRPQFGVSPESFFVGAEDTSVEINVTGNVDWTVVAGDGITSVSPEEGSGEGTVTVTFPANTSAEDVEYSLLIGTDASGVENDEFEISIMQAGLAAKAYPYEESFASGQGSFIIDDVFLAEGLSFVWTHDTHNSDKYMKGTAYVNGGNKVAESWLVSPLVDLSEATQPALSFKHAVNFFTSIDKAKEEATVWARRGVGDTWEQLSGINYPATMSYTFVNSGEIDLSEYAGGEVQIGFKYVSTATKAGTWEVKDFKIAELSGPLNPTFSVPATLSVDKGGTAKIDVTTNSDGAVTFTSANPGVATVAEDGTVTGVAVGSTTVTVAVAATSRYSAASGTVTVTVSDPGLHDIVAADFGAPSFVAGEYVVTSAKGTGGSNPSYVSGDKDIRLYAGNTITVKNRTAPVTRIVFNLSAQGLKRLAPITASTGTVTAQKAGDTTVEWTGSASEVTFTVGAKADYGSEGNTKAGQLDFTSISVDPWTGVTPAKQLVSIAIEGQKTVYFVNDALEKGTVTATFDDDTTAEVTDDAVFSGYDLSTAGSYTVKVSYTYGGVTKETSYGITVAAPGSWTRVKTVAELLAGGTFIIGYEATANSGVIVPMQNTGTATTSAAGLMYSGTTTGSSGSTTVDMATLKVEDASPYLVTISASTLVTGAVNIVVGGSYLGNTDTKNNCKLFSEPSKNTAFTPTVGDNDVFTLTIAENATYTTLQYNPSSPRFAVYGGGQKNVVIYKQ